MDQTICTNDSAGSLSSGILRTFPPLLENGLDSFSVLGRQTVPNYAQDFEPEQGRVDEEVTQPEVTVRPSATLPKIQNISFDCFSKAAQ
jgi:hypothetical protein